MKREEEIHNVANTISTNIGKEIDEDYICNDVYDFTIGFICGAKWVIKCLSTIPIDEVLDEVVELYEEISRKKN